MHKIFGSAHSPEMDQHAGEVLFETAINANLIFELNPFFKKDLGKKREN